MFLQNFAQSTAECTVNGQAVDCGDAAKAAGGILAGFGIFMLVLFALGIFSTIIWILSLVHLIQHEDVENRMLWIVLVFLVPLANFVYYFGFKRSYDKQHKGSQTQPDSAPAPGASPGVVTPQQDTSVGSNIAAGAAGGAAAASSGFPASDPTPTPDSSIAGSADQPATDIGLQDDVDSSDNAQVAQADSQADSAPVYSPDESSADSSSETTDTITPETDSYQSGSTEEPAVPEDSVSQPTDPRAASPEDGLGGSDSNQDDQNTPGNPGSSIG